MLISEAIAPDSKIARACGDCTRCIKACPTQAIAPDGSLNERRCLSFISQAKSEIEPELLKKLNTYVYGCDLCQEACPFNCGIDSHQHELCEPSGVEFVEIDKLMSLTQKQFKAEYGHLAGSWRGVGVIKRNALMNALYYRYRGILPHATSILEGNSPDWLKQSARLVVEEFEKL